jgi:cell division protein FtsW
MKWLLSHIKGDVHIWLIVLLMTIISIFVVYSSTESLAYMKRSGNTEYYLIRQLVFIFIGLMLMYAAHSINYAYYSRLAQVLLYLSFPLLIITIMFGPTINQANRWLVLPGTNFTFQTSDLAKLALIMFIARTLSKKQEHIKDFKKTFLPIIIAVGGICGIIAMSDISTSILLFLSSMLLMFIGRINMKYLFAMIGILLVLGFTVYQLSPRKETAQARLETHFSGEDSYQEQQSKIAIAVGGIIGRGPGHSIQKNFLPNPYSDYIYSIIIEEWGMVGGIVVIMLYLWLFFRTVRIVIKSPNAFGALLAIGLSSSLVLQAFVNMGVATSLLPVTGLTLPLISMGGTSVLFTSISFGIILSVSRYIEENQNEKELAVVENE